MLKVKNLGFQAFKQYIEKKKIFVIGAGRALESIYDIYFADKRIDLITDNNQLLWGKKKQYCGITYEVLPISKLVEEVKKNGREGIVCFVSTSIYALDILNQLDKIDELSEVECFFQVLIRNTKEYTEPYSFTKGKERIPRIFHYIWVGKKNLPDEAKRNIDSWMQFNPDYKLELWNESNYDFLKGRYTREAYESGLWGFAINQARLDIIYDNGGIYLDTDVEVLRNMDQLLNDDAFFNYGCGDRINQGCGFGAIKGHKIVKDMMDAFEKVGFLDEKGLPAKRPCYSYIHPILRKYGFSLVGSYEKENGVVLYPAEVMSPLRPDGFDSWFSKNTISVHKCEGTWKNKKELEVDHSIKQLIARVSE